MISVLEIAIAESERLESQTVIIDVNQFLDSPAVGMAFNLSNSLSTFCHAFGFFFSCELLLGVRVIGENVTA